MKIKLTSVGSIMSLVPATIASYLRSSCQHRLYEVMFGNHLLKWSIPLSGFPDGTEEKFEILVGEACRIDHPWSA